MKIYDPACRLRPGSGSRRFRPGAGQGLLSRAPSSAVSPVTWRTMASLGAAGGCAVGHHMASEKEKQAEQQQVSMQDAAAAYAKSGRHVVARMSGWTAVATSSAVLTGVWTRHVTREPAPSR